MPYKHKKNRRKWETSPDQRIQASVRQDAARERRAELYSLAAVYQIHQRCGHWKFCGPSLREKVECKEKEIKSLLAARSKETVEVYVDGLKVRDFLKTSRTQLPKKDHR